MLIEFYGKNFGCFRDEFRLSMLATDIDRDSKRGIVEVKIEGDDEPLKLLRAAAIYGPNASGKSTLMRAASGLSYLLAVSHQFSSDDVLPPYEPFALGPEKAHDVTLGAKAVIDGTVYEYCASFNREAVAEEKLSSLSGERPLVLFWRKGQAVEGAWLEDPQFGLLSNGFRENALLLALADSLAPKLAKGIAVGFRRMLMFWNPVPWLPYRVQPAADRIHRDDAFCGWVRARLKAADFGVVDVHTVEEARERRRRDDDGALGAESQDAGRVVTKLFLLHAGAEGTVALPMSRESQGTQMFLGLAPLLYDLASVGPTHAVFADEFDASIHPTLLEGLVSEFNCDLPVDRVHGQLIFAVHETSLIDAEARDAALRRDQVYFTEKDNAGASRLYSVAEFRERNNLNMRRRYLQGRYGALPVLGTFGD